jgi:hypothetical protein
LHQPTNFLVYGAIDDLWVNSQSGEWHIVDYKATSKDETPTLDGRWQQAFKRQMEIYQWLFRQNGFSVSDIGYFVYVNGRRDREAFDGRLEFDAAVIPYRGGDSWVAPALGRARECLLAPKAPAVSPTFEYCYYREAARAAEK